MAKEKATLGEIQPEPFGLSDFWNEQEQGMRILLCEDERELAEALAEILKHNNYSVDIVHDGEEALDYMATNNYDGILLDIMIPKQDGLQVLKKLREQKDHTPVLMLTAKSLTEDKVKGLDLGADDYLTKPFETQELLARIRAMTRRNVPMTDNVLKAGDCALDRSSFQLRGSRGEVRLNNKEFQMLEMLMVRPGNIISAETLMDRIWGFESEAELSIVWVYISYLRKKIASVSESLQIKAVRNVGYQLESIDGKET